MSAAPPLLVSVPSIELNRVKLEGSVFDARRLLAAPFSHSLLQAVQIVLDHFGARHTEVLCVARPEMFTHGELLGWLRERTRGAATHLCISNGQTLKVIPGLHNDMFVYGLHRDSSLKHFRVLLRRAPELLAGFKRQYNSSHETEAAAGDLAPSSNLLQAARTYASSGIHWHFPFYLNRHSHDDSGERMLKWGSTKLPPLTGYERVVLVDCNESAMQDTLFCHALANLVARAAHTPSLGLLLLLPDPEDPKAEMIARMARVLEGIQRGRTAVPRIRMENLQLCTGLEEDEFLALERPFELVLHESTPLWAYTHAFYAAASEVHLYRARKPLGAQARNEQIQQGLMGRKPLVHEWTPRFVERFGMEAH